MIKLHDNIYHYTKAETFINDIFPSKTLMMRQLKYMNDPRESKEWPFKFYAQTKNGYENFDLNLFDICSKYITESTNVLSTVIDFPSINDNDIIEDVSKTGYGHPRMWAQYADNHAGVCLVLNKFKFEKEIEAKLGNKILYHQAIEYLDTPIGFNQNAYSISNLEKFISSGIENSLELHIEENYKELFFTKHTDWRDENEYRWIYRGENLNKPVFVPIEKSIYGIILGDSISQENKKKILNLCRPCSIPVFSLFQFGWTTLISEIKNETQIISPMSFSQLIPCLAVIMPAVDSNRNTISISAESTTGNVKVLNHKKD